MRINVYFVKNFDCKTDIPMEYLFRERLLFYSEEDVLQDIHFVLNQIHSDYEERTNCIIERDFFFNKFPPFIEIAVVSLHHRNLTTQKEYEKYLKEVKTIPKEELKDYLLSYTDNCVFWYDHNLILKDTYCRLENSKVDTEIFLQFTFSYKALFPEKYHVEKYEKGDKVLYEGSEWIISNKYNKSIFESDDPLNHRFGYELTDGYGYYLQDDRWCYFPVDEDLQLISKENNEIEKMINYIFIITITLYINYIFKRSWRNIKMKRGEILDDAKKTICNDRQDIYGNPEDSFPIIAKYWETYLSQITGKEIKLTARNAADMLCLFKMARITTGKFKEDNYIDLCGYSAIAGSLGEKTNVRCKVQEVDKKNKNQRIYSTCSFNYNNKSWHDYDKSGNCIHSKGSDGFEESYEYDENGNCIHYKNSEGFEEWKEYDENGKLIHCKDSNGFEE